MHGQDPSPPARDDKVLGMTPCSAQQSHLHGALGGMRGFSRSDAQAARLPASGQRRGREPVNQMHAAGACTARQLESTAPQ